MVVKTPPKRIPSAIIFIFERSVRLAIKMMMAAIMDMIDTFRLYVGLFFCPRFDNIIQVEAIPRKVIFCPSACFVCLVLPL